MSRKILCLIFCSLCFITTKAQQVYKVNIVLDSIRSNLKNLYNDTTVNETCRNSIKGLSKSFLKINGKSLTAQSVKDLKESVSKLESVTKRSVIVQCYDSRLNNLFRSRDNLLAELNKPDGLKKQKDSVIASVARDTSTEGSDEFVNLKIIVRDSTNRAVKANLVIDSLGTTINRYKNTDTGKFEVLLTRGKKYSVIATAENKSFEEVFESDNRQDSLMITLGGRVPVEDNTEAGKENLSKPYLAASSNASILFLLSMAILFILVFWATSRYVQTLTGFKPVINKLSDQAVTMENNQPILENFPADNESTESTVPLNVEPVPVEVDPEPVEIEDGALKIEPVSFVEPELLNQSDDLFIDETAVQEKEDVEAPVLLEEKPEPVVAVFPKETSNNNANHYFVCEVMMTAGPRKKFMSEENADRDLGEDVCGFVLHGDEVFIWLLDGTSDLHCLREPVSKREYFSSRLLAQSVAEKLRKFFIEKPGMPFSEMIMPSILEVKSNWLDAIEQLPAAEKQVLRNNIENKNLPECATTLLMASLKLNGDFTSYRTGDSKLFLFEGASQKGVVLVQTLLEDKNEKSNDRIFFRLWLNEQGKFDIIFNEPLHETENKKNISTIISFSDGIGAATEQLLKDDYKTKPDKVRKEIIYQAQETGDDKTIYFIEIKESQ
ncbi:MAG: hypothetical protein ABIN89_17780 [Chitinophagaceae bacterium]